MAYLILPPNTVLYDVAIEGYQPGSTGIEEVLNQQALENALMLFLLASPGDYLGQPEKGGLLIEQLTKPMRQIDALDLQTSLSLALQNDFSPSLQTYNIQVIPDWTNYVWQVNFAWVAPQLKLSGNFSQSITGRAS